MYDVMFVFHHILIFTFRKVTYIFLSHNMGNFIILSSNAEKRSSQTIMNKNRSLNQGSILSFLL